jgi:hypothetical protein
MRMIMEDVLKIFQESLLKETREIEDAEERLAVAMVLYLRVLEQHREKALLLYQKSSSLDQASKARVMQLEVEVANIFGSIIQDGIRQGVFREVDVDLMAYNILILAHMWVLKGWHFKKRLTLDKYIDLQLTSVLGMLRR